MTKENTKQADKQKGTDANRDPITGTPGAHPVGTGVGAAGGAAAGAYPVDSGLQLVQVIGPVGIHGRRLIEVHDEGAVGLRLQRLHQELGGRLLLELEP